MSQRKDGLWSACQSMQHHLQMAIEMPVKVTTFVTATNMMQIYCSVSSIVEINQIVSSMPHDKGYSYWPVQFAIPNQVSRAAKAFSSSSSSALSSSDHSLSNRYWSAIWKSMYFVKSSVKLYHDSMSCSSRPHRIHDQIFKGNNFSVGEVTSVKKSPGWLVLLKILVLI